MNMKKHIVANIAAYDQEAAIEFQKFLDAGYEIINSVSIDKCVQYVLCKELESEKSYLFDDTGLPVDLPPFPNDRLG